MIITPMVRNNICLNAHPEGCARFVNEQIEYVQRKVALFPLAPLKNVLIIGASGGYGLASRIVAAFGHRAKTLGVAFEKAASGKRTATPGWYCNEAFLDAAKREGLAADTIIGDAFSDEIRDQTIARIKRDYGKIDLLVYSLASGVRTDPATGTTYRSVLKPIGTSYHARTLDLMKETLFDISVEPATESEIEATVKVMGGEDWQLWSDALLKHDLFAPDALNVAYSYIGPELTFPIYRDGTIGRAKLHLEESAHKITAAMEGVNGHAYVSVNKAVATRASAVIPVVPLYLAILFKVMKEHNLHEEVIEQIYRLFSGRLYASYDPTEDPFENEIDPVPESEIETDKEGRIRIDDWEMRDEVQRRVTEIWPKVTEENIKEISDLEGYRRAFLNLHGFGFDDIDYQREVSA